MGFCLRQRITPFLQEPGGEKKMKIDKFHAFSSLEKANASYCRGVTQLSGGHPGSLSGVNLTVPHLPKRERVAPVAPVFFDLFYHQRESKV